MKIVIAPDKFKGSLAADLVAAAIAAGLRAELPAAELVTMPVADGGDGTVDAAVAAGLERVPVTVAGPTGEPVAASYARRGGRAVVELACACGLALLPGGRREPLAASSFGAGQVLAAVLEAGATLGAGTRQIIFGVGGSASTDGGAGLLQALGAQVLDGRGRPLAWGGGALRDVAALDLTGLHPGLRDCSVILATDVTNPLTGPDGAAEVYGPQKGATPAQVSELASGLRRWAAVVAAATGADWSRTPGAGAAGGVGFAALAVLGAVAQPGITVVLDLVGFEAALDGADLVITGEGSLDAQNSVRQGAGRGGAGRRPARHPSHRGGRAQHADRGPAGRGRDHGGLPAERPGTRPGPVKRRGWPAARARGPGGGPRGPGGGAAGHEPGGPGPGRAAGRLITRTET